MKLDEAKARCRNLMGGLLLPFPSDVEAVHVAVTHGESLEREVGRLTAVLARLARPEVTITNGDVVCTGRHFLEQNGLAAVARRAASGEG